MSDFERAASEQRLDVAVEERERAKGERDQATGTPAEMEAAVTVRAAEERVHARERWLDWVRERDE